MPVSAAQIASLVACDIEVPVRCCIPFPGGGELCVTGFDFDPLVLLAPHIGALNASMIPFMPIFRIINVLLDIVDCIKAVPQVLINPGAVIQCIVKLVKDLVEVIKLIPYISLPFTLVAILDCVRLFLRAIRDTIVRIAARFTSISIIIATSTDLNQIYIAQCELKLLNAQLGNINALLAAVSTIFRVINLFLGLLQLPELPTSISVGTDPGAAAELLDPIIEALDYVRSFIPI